MPGLRPMSKRRSVPPRVSPLMSEPVRRVKGIPLRMKTDGLRLTSAKTREAKLWPGPALNGLSKTPLNTKLCRMSNADKERSVKRREGKGGAKEELKSV